jgi:hypothetical protein
VLAFAGVGGACGGPTGAADTLQDAGPGTEQQVHDFGRSGVTVTTMVQGNVVRGVVRRDHDDAIVHERTFERAALEDLDVVAGAISMEQADDRVHGTAGVRTLASYAAERPTFRNADCSNLEFGDGCLYSPCNGLALDAYWCVECWSGGTYEYDCEEF